MRCRVHLHGGLIAGIRLTYHTYFTIRFIKVSFNGIMYSSQLEHYAILIDTLTNSYLILPRNSCCIVTWCYFVIKAGLLLSCLFSFLLPIYSKLRVSYFVAVKFA